MNDAMWNREVVGLEDAITRVGEKIQEALGAGDVPEWKRLVCSLYCLEFAYGLRLKLDSEAES